MATTITNCRINGVQLLSVTGDHAHFQFKALLTLGANGESNEGVEVTGGVGTLSPDVHEAWESFCTALETALANALGTAETTAKQEAQPPRAILPI